MKLRDLFEMNKKFPRNLKEQPPNSMMAKPQLKGRPEIFADKEGKRYIPEMHLKGFLQRKQRGY